jgi:hypothetical protein
MQGSDGDINKVSKVCLQHLVKNNNSNQNKKIDGCPDWIPIGMDTILNPNTLVTDLDAAGGYLRASTHGRGL